MILTHLKFRSKLTATLNDANKTNTTLIQTKIKQQKAANNNPLLSVTPGLTATSMWARGNSERWKREILIKRGLDFDFEELDKIFV